MKKYKYKVCSLCKQHKIENRNPYCRGCSKTYSKNYRLIKKLKPNVNLIGLGNFIKKVQSQRHFIDFSDINNIIFFYEIITTNINEYDQYKSGKQIVLMWQRINKYYKRHNQEKNI
jgi:hypothetical protein